MADQTMAARVTGRVQGVAFRAWTQAEAEALELSGWVRNAADGSVEAVFRGPAPALERMRQALHHGPPAARVTAVDWRETEAFEGRGFSIRR